MSEHQFLTMEHKTPDELLEMKAKFKGRSETDESGHYMAYYQKGKDLYCTILKTA